MEILQGKFLQSADAQIFYIDNLPPFEGAQTLIFLHGNGEDHSYFAHQLSFFAPKYRLVLMDTRGHGKSTAGQSDLDFSIFAQDLLRLMDALHLTQAHLLGFSDGGNLALTFALQHPERVCSLILNGANLNPSGVKPLVQLPVVLGYWLCKLFAAKSEDAAKHLAILGLMVNHPHILPKELSALTMPSLVIVGEHDMIKHRHSRLIADSLPNAKLICLKDTDHFCAAKCPDAFNKAVDDFLSSCTQI